MEKDVKISVKKSKPGKKKKNVSKKAKANTKNQPSRDKINPVRQISSAHDYTAWNRSNQQNLQQGTLSGKKTPPFVAGTAVSKTHNIGLKIQEIKKAKRRARGELSNRQQACLAAKVQSKAQTSTVEIANSNKAKIKEMFVDLHNEFADLMREHASLKMNGTGGENQDKLERVERELNKKELQINIVVQLYDENIKLKEELCKLRDKKKTNGKIGKKSEVEEELKTKNMVAS